MNYFIELVAGNYAEAQKVVRRKADGGFIDNQFYYAPGSLLLGNLERFRGNAAGAKQFYERARAYLERKIKENPQDERLYSALGIAYAGLGRKDDAVRYGLRGTAMLPVEKEAWRGSARLIDLARIYTFIGDQDKAIDTLEKLLSIPSEMSATILKVEPWWKPLQSNPRFQKLIAGGDQPST